jgi:hypothetical protein
LNPVRHDVPLAHKLLSARLLLHFPLRLRHDAFQKLETDEDAPLLSLVPDRLDEKVKYEADEVPVRRSAEPVWPVDRTVDWKR